MTRGVTARGGVRKHARFGRLFRGHSVSRLWRTEAEALRAYAFYRFACKSVPTYSYLIANRYGEA